MLNIYSNGITLGVPPSRISPPTGKRTASVGWSENSTRNNTVFLYSVDSGSLSGFGYAFTFTLRDLPETPAEWSTIRDKFFKRCARMGMIRYHWVTEWQRRGVPHLHGCLYFLEELTPSQLRSLKAAWCDCVGRYFALQKGQDIKKIETALGWLKYLAKHGSRSKHHYQRSSKPAAWDSSGRVWGKGGEWPVRHTQHDLGALFFGFRRLVRRWRIADARTPLPIVDADGKTIAAPGDLQYLKWFPAGVGAPRNSRRIRQARRCLTCGDRSHSSVRGMSEWIGESLAFRMVQFLEDSSSERGGTR